MELGSIYFTHFIEKCGPPGGPNILRGVHIFQCNSEKLVPGGPHFSEKFVLGGPFLGGPILM